MSPKRPHNLHATGQHGQGGAIVDCCLQVDAPMQEITSLAKRIAKYI